jgi:hypothetical protein
MIEDTEYEPSEAIYFGDPPSLPRSATKGLPPARTRFAAYIAWRNKIVDEISGLVFRLFGGLLSQSTQRGALAKTATRRPSWLLVLVRMTLATFSAR